MEFSKLSSKLSVCIGNRYAYHGKPSEWSGRWMPIAGRSAERMSSAALCAVACQMGGVSMRGVLKVKFKVIGMHRQSVCLSRQAVAVVWSLHTRRTDGVFSSFWGTSGTPR